MPSSPENHALVFAKLDVALEAAKGLGVALEAACVMRARGLC